MLFVFILEVNCLKTKLELCLDGRCTLYLIFWKYNTVFARQGVYLDQYYCF